MDDVLLPTDLVRGPWDHGLQHGGAVCGALAWVAEQAQAVMAETEAADRFMLARLTVEILRPVPVAPLSYRSSIARNGRRSRVLGASLWHGERCVARCSSQWVKTDVRQSASHSESQSDSRSESEVDSQVDSRPDPSVPLRPTTATDPGSSELGYPRPGFNCDVFELRCLSGSTEDPGPATVWARMKTDLVSGHALSPIQMLATVSDLGNAVGWDLSLRGEPMVNPDVTLQLFRYPVGEWVCLESNSRSTPAGVGMMETRLWDGHGQIGRVLSTTMESIMPLTADLLPGRESGPDQL